MKKVIMFVATVIWMVGCGVEGENKLYCGDGTMQVGDTCIAETAENENVNPKIKEQSDIPAVKCGEGTVLDEENNTFLTKRSKK